MCRLFAQIALAPRAADDFLIDSEFSLLRQSRAKRGCLQRDGWGLGWYDKDGRAVVRRSPNPIYKEVALLRETAGQALSRVVIGHVRAASNPLKLERSRLISEANCQPFTDGRWLFAHNGTLNIPRETASALGRLKARLRAQNDSEVYFWHLRKHIERAGAFHEAVRCAALELWDIWDGCKKRHPGKQGPYTSLNAVLSDGTALYAVCHAAGRGMAAFGLCHPEQPWSQMSFTRRAQRLVVASEGFDCGAWTRLRPPETLTARPSHAGLTVECRALAGLPQMALPAQETLV